MEYKKQKPWYVVFLGLALGVSVYVAFWSYETQVNRAKENFSHMAHENVMTIINDFEWHKGVMEYLGSFFLSSQSVDDEEFTTFTRASFTMHDTFDALGWVSFNNEDNSYQWEHIRPNIYADMLQNNIAADDLILNMLREAQRTGKTSYFVERLNKFSFRDIHHSGGHTHGNDAGRTDEEYHVFIIYPVYEENSSNLKGMAFSILDIRNLVRQVTKREEGSIYGLKITYINSDNDEVVLYDKGNGVVDNVYTMTEDVILANQEMTFHFLPTREFLQKNETYVAYIMFGALFALILAVFYMRQMRNLIGELTIARKKAEEINRLKDNFLATMSHEIRTPMNGIMGMAELILGTKPSPQIERHARTIIHSSENLHHIINDVLDFSKIEAGKLEFDPMPVDLLDLVDEVGMLYNVPARDKAVELVIRYTPGTEQFVMADPNRLRQVLGNLVNNAIKFTDQGHVTLTVQEEHLEKHIPGQVMMRFDVEDTGVGMEEEALDRIFDKFSQVDSSTTRNFGGTGLGLAICKSLVEMMGGKISVKTDLGRGSTFTVLMPFKRNAEEAIKQPKSEILKNINVLIVDDLPVVLDLVSEQLTLVGVNCTTANSGQEALLKMLDADKAGNPFQIVVIDYLMPHMNGEMLASAINDHEELRKSCLVMLTAAGNPLASDTFAEKGFSAYIAKPVQNKSLVKGLSLVWKKYQEGYTDVLIHVDAHTVQIEGQDEEDIKLTGRNILITEDNLVNQVFIQEILEEMECNYTVASNGEEAVEQLLSQSFDLVLMDCLMPVMDGFEATGEIRELQARGQLPKDIPIVALTANAIKGDREKCLNAGMDDYLAKPVRRKELKAMVCKWVLGEHWKQEAEEKIMEENQPTINLPDETDQQTKKSVQNKRNTSNTPTEDGLEILDQPSVEKARDILKNKYDAMVTVYLQNSRERIDELLAAVKANDTEAMIRPAHTLKSTSKQMGAMRLSEMAKAIEMTAKAATKNGDADMTEFGDVYASLDELSATLSETQRAFKDMAA